MTDTRQSRTGKTAGTLNFIVITSAVFMANLDLWVANVALPTIGVSFHQASLANLSWVLNAYSIVLAALLITAGRLGDRVGNLKLFLGGILIFTIGSLLCAVATSFSFLIVGRIVQAAGAAGQLPASLALLMATVPEHRRHEAGRLWAAVGGMAAALGPVIGGLLVEVSWRWIFLINVPIGLVMLLVGARVLSRLSARARTGEPLPDLLGAALLAISIAALTGGLVQAPHWGWSSGQTLGMFAICLAAAIVFGLRCWTHKVPLIEGSIVRNRLFVVANLANLVFNAALAIFLLSITLWCQEIWHYSAVKTGFALAPSPALVPIVAILTIPVLRKFGTRPVCVLGALIYCGSAVWMLATATLEPGYARELLPGLLLTGLGFGMTAATLMGSAAAALPPERAATGSAVVNAGRQVAANFGVAILVTIFGAEAFGAEARYTVIEHLFRVGWFVGGALALAAAIICLWLPRTDREDKVKASPA